MQQARKLHGGKHSLPQKVSLRHACGMSHPIGQSGSFPENTNQKPVFADRLLIW